MWTLRPHTRSEGIAGTALELKSTRSKIDVRLVVSTLEALKINTAARSDLLRHQYENILYNNIVAKSDVASIRHSLGEPRNRTEQNNIPSAWLGRCARSFASEDAKYYRRLSYLPELNRN